MTDICVGFLEMLRGWVMGLPDLSLDNAYISQMVNAVGVIVDFIKQVNFFVPVDTILLILSLVYGFKLLKFGVFLVNWVIRRIADIIP